MDAALDDADKLLAIGLSFLSSGGKAVTGSMVAGSLSGLLRRPLTAWGADIPEANPPGGGACFAFWLPSFEPEDGR